MRRRSGLLLLPCLLLSLSIVAQQNVGGSPMNSDPAVPRLIRFSGTVLDAGGQPPTGVVGATFSLYVQQRGGAPLWMETQNIQPDQGGHYSVLLGSATRLGLPSNLFTNGEAKWLGIQVQGQDEQPRVLMVSVPYALKAADAETVGGLPPSAFMLAPTFPTSTASPTTNTTDNLPAIGGSGTQNFIPVWTSTTNLGDSIMFQSGAKRIGIGTKTPSALLDINGSLTARGNFLLPPTGTATAAKGFNSQPLSIEGSSFNSATGQAIAPKFQWQTEPVGNNTANPAGTLNLLYDNGSGSPIETGLNIANNGQITFADGQKFPGTGTITGITAGEGLTGGGTSGNVTLGVNFTLADGYFARLNYDNVFTGNQTVKGSVVASSFTGSGSGLTQLQGTNVQGAVASSNNASNLGGQPPSAYQPAGSYATTGSNTFNGNQTVNGSMNITGTTSGVTAKVTGSSAVALQASNPKGTVQMATPTLLLNGTVGGSSLFSVDPTGAVLANTMVLGKSSGIVFQAENTGGGVVSLATPTFLISSFSNTGTGFTVDDFGNGFFGGNLTVTGTLSKGSGSFKIDHPLDPGHKYLSHSFVESPDMMNVYNGNLVTNRRGVAVVTLPDYFEALNRDFRYQLTVIGQFAQAIVLRKIKENRFVIKTDKPNIEVSWQVTGIRHDAYANAYRIPVEEQKAPGEQGHYLHPEVFGATPEARVQPDGARALAR